MAQTCTKCSRVNPGEASYCYYDGSLLEGHSQNGGAAKGGTQTFPSHFVFPNGLICRNWDQLAQACQENWPAAVDLLQQGFLESFMGGLGRADLAFAAREAARFPDRDRGLDQLLSKLPSQVLEPPKLKVEPRDLNMGIIQVGDNRQLELHLNNQGSRLLYGTVTVDDCKWLTLGDAPGTSQKVFQFGGELTIPIQVRGANLRAGTKPLEGKLLIESNGGNSSVVIHCEVPVKPFPAGVLAGARSPRQVAEKANAATKSGKEHAKEAAALFEKGAVADWYKSNGWTYPVQGPSAAGLGALQQFFEALGLTAPPKVEISERAINLTGSVGEHLKHVLEVKAVEKRPVFAHCTSDQPWLVPERAQLNGRTATIAVTVPAVPNRPGEVLQGKVTVISNGNQRFVVPVSLQVSGSYGQPILMQPAPEVPVFANLMDEPAPVVMTPVVMAPVVSAPIVTSPIMAPMASPARPPSRPEIMAVPAPAPVLMTEEAPTPRRRVRKGPFWIHLLPLLAVALGLLGMVIHDFFVQAPMEEEAPVRPGVVVDVDFLDGPFMIGNEEDARPGKKSLRFGFFLPEVDDPAADPRDNPNKKKRLTYFSNGRSNNTVIRIDDGEAMLGSPSVPPKELRLLNIAGQPEKLRPILTGNWVKDTTKLGSAHDGPDKQSRKRTGRKSVYQYETEDGVPINVTVTQTVEIIPNEQPSEVEYKKKKQEMRLLDTALVTYEIVNNDKRPHKVGIRFLLDTFIGSNDGVPFIIPGSPGLQDTLQEFDSSKGKPIPDYIEALEKPNLDNPGTIAHLSLRIPGREPPGRVTLGAWPHTSLGPKVNNVPGAVNAHGHMTWWEVPFVSMKSGGRNDSAVTMYWEEKELGPGKTRVVGFAYGLGNFAGGGRLGLSTGGDFSEGGTFTVNAVIDDPKPNESVTLSLPKGFELVEGKEKQAVPAPTDPKVNRSTVTWKVKATIIGRKFIKVSTDKGATQSKPVTIKGKVGAFG